MSLLKPTKIAADIRPYFVVMQTSGTIWDGKAKNADDAARQAYDAEWDPNSMRFVYGKAKPLLVYTHENGESSFQKEVRFSEIQAAP